MNILVVNCGSSSVKADVIDTETGERLTQIRIERVGTDECQYRVNNGDAVSLAQSDHRMALTTTLQYIEVSFEAIGHRVVHGGEHFSSPVRIDAKVLEVLQQLIPLAPLHNPANISGIEACKALFPALQQVAIFDTAFHSTLPRRAKVYAIPEHLSQKHGIRRYGFHGPSHQWVSQRAAQFLREDLQNLRVITCHLGNGASVCAIEYGRSVETSMGLTPLEGLVMGTRSGDIDPGALLALAQAEGLNWSQMERLLNKESGLAGLSGVGNDMRDILSKAAAGDDNCRLAINVFVHRLRKYIGAYAAVMGGVDVLVFTAGVGENSAVIRHRICQYLDFLGLRLDVEKNTDSQVDKDHPVADISELYSRGRILVVATDEELSIAQQTAQLVLKKDKVSNRRGIPIAISARHVHLTRQSVETLFGEGAELTKYRDISQPGQYACNEKVDLIGPKRRIDGVRVIGPIRPKNQVEISRTDEYTLGVDAPIRNSGDVKNSPGILLIGPKGKVLLKEGLICARRHIHMHPDDAEYFRVKDRDVVEVAVDTEGRDLIFGDVLVRVSKRYKLEMHIDTDEANAAEIRKGTEGILAQTEALVRLRRKEL